MTGYFKSFDRALCGHNRNDDCDRGSRSGRHHRRHRRDRSRSGRGWSY